MAEDRFHDPHVGLSRIYTRTGDDGTTGLVGGQRVSKADLRIEAYGTVDELNAVVGLCVVEAQKQAATAELASTWIHVQHALFNLGSCLSTLPADLHPKQPRITPEDVMHLEAAMDAMSKLPPLRSFVLPGGSELNARLHLARTVCRRAERLVVALDARDGCARIEARYLNRLSDAFFVWSRDAARRLRHDEVMWQPNQA